MDGWVDVFFKSWRRKLASDKTYLETIKTRYDKVGAYIILNGEKQKTFPLKPEIKQKCSPSFIIQCYCYLFKVLVKTTRQKKFLSLKFKSRMKLSLFTDMILHLKDPVDSARKLLDLINTFNKVVNYINI